jgi:hypothetical protein
LARLSVSVSVKGGLGNVSNNQSKTDVCTKACVVPLMLSSGAGAEMRRTLGIAVFSGMIGVTVFGVFLTPVFYYVLSGWAGVGSAVQEKQSAPGG